MGTLVEKQPVVTEKYDFENRDESKMLALFWNIWKINNPNEGTKWLAAKSVILLEK